MISFSKLQAQRNTFEYFIDLFFRIFRIFLSKNIRLSLTVMSRHHSFLFSGRFQPTVINQITRSRIDSLQIWIKVTFANFATIVFRLSVDTAGVISILIYIDFLHYIILKIFDLILLVQISLFNRFFDLNDNHIASSQ